MTIDKDKFLSAEEDVLDFAAEEVSGKTEEQPEEKWKIIIVDDEQEVHRLTKMVLKDVTFDGRGLEFISAYNGVEANKLIKENPDTAIILLDVVMEEDDAGLKVAKYIREELNNRFVRIILRTGQPGRAPEEKVIKEYDINDYKEKTELTFTKLYTTIIAALRSYRDIMIIDASRKGLEKVIDASATIFKLQSMKKFASGILEQLISILKLDKNALYCQVSGFAAVKNEEDFYVLAATGDYEQYVNHTLKEALPGEALTGLQKVLKEKKSMYFDKNYVAYFKSQNNSENMIYLEGLSDLNELDKGMIELFCANISIAFDNIYLKQEIEDTQKEIIFALGEVAEVRSRETGNHIRRVAAYCELLGTKYGLSEEEVVILKLASPMHDIGKIAIQDAVLNKPGTFTAEEYEIMKSHVLAAQDIFRHSNRRILQAAATIALQHHERYDGTGYPKGLKGEGIDIYGRITAVADVFDALSTDRVYRKAWNLDDIIKYFKAERGKHFDAKIVDILLDNIDEFIQIKNTIYDEKPISFPILQ